HQFLPSLPTRRPSDLRGGVATAVALPPSLDLNELQMFGPGEIEKLCRDFEVRVHAGRTRHQQILDIVRAALIRNIQVTAEGFFRSEEHTSELQSPDHL